MLELCLDDCGAESSSNREDLGLAGGSSSPNSDIALKDGAVCVRPESGHVASEIRSDGVEMEWKSWNTASRLAALPIGQLGSCPIQSR